MKLTRLQFSRRERQGEGEQSACSAPRDYEAVLRQAQTGNEEARQELCRFAFDSALKFASAAGLPALYDVKDFAQDTVLEVVQQLGRIQRLRGWLPAVLVGLRALAFRRHHGRLIHRLVESESGMMASDEYTGPAEDNQLAARLDFQLIVNHLAEPDKSIIIMHCVDDMSFEEISKTLGLTAGNVRMHFLRAKKRLRKYLNLQDGRDSGHGIVVARAPETAACPAG